ncbi:bifunctional phosphoribosyl-AMP cyclohydrolase/phosphoribosyl-ATP diphosphatase HisIE [Patescibacteria group bacterium]|nr:bifunctional phosphoribosyl-AMP cyclohydrolase/phosphoribosyl-ATP diphosphatase HisIE [Patescibacteria group bacterium]
MNLNFKKLNGLIPAIVQDSETMQVLMLGFMNEEAYIQTKKSGKATFFSRTKNRLWQKGETSKNYLKVKEIKIDCDNDTLLIMAKPQGPTCHKNKYSCFGDKKNNSLFLKELFQIIKDRKRKRPKNSYTASLFNDGLDEIIKKVGEENIELIIAAKSETKQRVIEESGDLLYHLLVLLAEKEIDLDEVVEELRGRSEK